MIFDALTYSVIAIALILAYVVVRLSRSKNKS
jgi:flagellar biogenesis protein FliO